MAGHGVSGVHSYGMHLLHGAPLFRAVGPAVLPIILQDDGESSPELRKGWVPRREEVEGCGKRDTRTMHLTQRPKRGS